MYPNRADLFRNYPELEPDDVQQALAFAAANLEDSADCKGHWIRASVSPDGSFTVTNSRNGFSRAYRAR